MKRSILILLACTVWAGSAHAQPDPAASGDDAAAEDGTAPAAAPAATAPDDAELAALRQEYLALRDRLFRSRARAAAVASALYSTKLTVNLDYQARHYRVRRATIRLDGADIFADTTGAIASDHASRFTGYVAPGDHLLGIRIEAVSTDDEAFTTILDNTVTLRAPADADLIVNATAADRGDLAARWETKRRGTYQLRLDIGVEGTARAKAGGD